MRIGIIYDDTAPKGLDCSRPDKGNPGVGGTQFCFLMLLYYLKKFYNEECLFVYRMKVNSSKLPCENQVIYRTVSNLEDSIKCALNDKVDLLLFNFTYMMDISSYIKRYEVKSVVWVHNWVRGRIIDEMAENEYIKRVVFLGREHYDRYIDADIISKAVVIPNMFNVIEQVNGREKFHVVTYTGALIPSKGFHVLAKAWKRVLEKVPDARLNVIGTGDLYGGNVQKGRFTPAEKSYEERFVKYIAGNDGKLLDSVKFMGNVGHEKDEIYAETKVGIVNPSGRTEVCPISALEMEAAGIPIVSKKINGLPDVVLNRKTGLLVKHEFYLANAISSLLTDEKKNKTFGDEARRYIMEQFSPRVVTEKWISMFKEVKHGKEALYSPPNSNYTNNFKFIRILNRQLRKLIIFRFLKPVIEVEDTVVRFIRR